MDLLQRLNIKKLNVGAYSGCSWQSTASASTISSFNPATGVGIADIALCSVDDYQRIVLAASTAFLSWRATPAPHRGEIIRQIAQALRDIKGDLGSLISLEMGKSKQEGDGEVQEMIDIADFAVGQSRMLYGKTMHSERSNHRMYEQWHPYGVVGIISAFNFPVAVWAWNAFIAAICGNTVIWKPSTKTPLCAIAVHNICSDVLRRNNCPDIFSLIIPVSREIAKIMVKDSRIPLISFTGSSAEGLEVATKVAGRLGRSILELGGNNAVIVDESADLKLAIAAIVFGVIGTAGQRCTSTRRVFVHKDRYDELVQLLQDAFAKISIGDPLDINNLMGPLIDEAAVAQFERAIIQIKQAGGRIICGGKLIAKRGNFVEPTLVAELDNNCAIVQTETFAPILYIMRYGELSEAIALQNSVAQGLSSALFTNNLQHAEYYLSELGSDCGIANINLGTFGAEVGGAFGGEKSSGGGREAGSDAWQAYMRRQTNTINWGDSLPLAQGLKFKLKHD